MKSSPAKTSSRLLSPELRARSADSYTVARDNSSITCHVCGHVSYDPQHVSAKFCPQCLVFHEDRVLMDRLQQGYQELLEAETPFQRGIPLAV